MPKKALRIQLRHGLIILSLGLRIRHLLFARVKIDQRLAGFDNLVLRDIHRGGRAANP